MKVLDKIVGSLIDALPIVLGGALTIIGIAAVITFSKEGPRSPLSCTERRPLRVGSLVRNTAALKPADGLFGNCTDSTKKTVTYLITGSETITITTLTQELEDALEAQDGN